MHRGLILLLVAAQVSALGWATTDERLPTSHATLWHVTAAHHGTTASQPREIRARSTCAVAAQSMLWPRTIPRGAAVAQWRTERVVSVPPLLRPERSPQPPLVLRI